MSKGRIALVNSPQFDYCMDYHCAGDCGHPHDSKEHAAYISHALETFDKLNAGKRRERKDAAEQVRQQAKHAL